MPTTRRQRLVVQMIKSFAQFGLIGLYTILVGPPIIVASFFDGGRTMLALGRVWVRWILGDVPRPHRRRRDSRTFPRTRP